MPFRFPRPNHCQHKRRGFNLTELAIVLGIAGTVLALVWSVITPIQDYNKQHQAMSEIVQVVPNVRAYFSNATGIPEFGYTDTVNQLCLFGVIPRFMSPSAGYRATSNWADGPWGNGGAATNGSFRVCYWIMSPVGGSTACSTAALASTSQTFAIELTNLTNTNCAGLVNAVTSPNGGPAGLVDVSINGTTAVASGTSPTIQPVPNAFTTGNCTSEGNANKNVVDFVYRLTAPAF